MTRALITGVTGQDGAYVARQLLNDGVDVWGSCRSAETLDGSPNLQALGVVKAVRPLVVDLTDPDSISAAVREARSDIVIHLAAASSVGRSWDEPAEVVAVNAVGTIHLLEACRTHAPGCRFVNASSSEIFAPTEGDGPKDEAAPFGPTTPYGVSKLSAHLITRIARNAHGMHASNAIMFNHESPLRGEQFVTRKITTILAAIANGADTVLELGNVAAQRDWGDAREYADALIRMARADAADDYVVATGKLTSVAQFAEAAAEALGIELVWQGKRLDMVGTWNGRTIVRINPQFFRPIDSAAMIGDPSRARDRLGWAPQATAMNVARDMATADMEAIISHQC